MILYMRLAVKFKAKNTKVNTEINICIGDLKLIVYVCTNI